MNSNPENHFPAAGQSSPGPGAAGQEKAATPPAGPVQEDLFAGRTLVIATQHGKEKVIAPVLEQALGVSCLVPGNLDTDAFGTFTGEIPRPGDALTAARRKSQLALELTGGDLVLASEGSFGPHPLVFVVPADEEVLLLTDKRHDLEIVARVISTATNFDSAAVSTEAQLTRFAESAGFPSHALILRQALTPGASLQKGITSWEELLKCFRQWRQQQQVVYVETDMRAMHNPSRLAVIAAAAHRLAEKALARCPQCHSPGFGVTRTQAGLPCRACGQPTASTRSLVSVCRQCQYTREDLYPNQLTTEDPAFCAACNP